MKRTIRKEVYETNSSSVHSLVVSNDGLEPSKFLPDKNGYIHVDYGEFGCDYNIYSTQYDKLSYLVTLCYYRADICGDTEDTYEFKKIERTICDYTNCYGVIIDKKKEPYIDHQSQPWECDIDIVDIYDKDSIVNFVFNKFVSLKTDRD